MIPNAKNSNDAKNVISNFLIKFKFSLELVNF